MLCVLFCVVTSAVLFIFWGFKFNGRKYHYIYLLIRAAIIECLSIMSSDNNIESTELLEPSLEVDSKPPVMVVKNRLICRRDAVVEAIDVDLSIARRVKKANFEIAPVPSSSSGVSIRLTKLTEKNYNLLLEEIKGGSSGAMPTLPTRPEFEIFRVGVVLKLSSSVVPLQVQITGDKKSQEKDREEIASAADEVEETEGITLPFMFVELVIQLTYDML